MCKSRKVKAKISRTVTEIAIVYLDKDDCIEEIDNIHDEIESEDEQVLSIIETLSVHS